MNISELNLRHNPFKDITPSADSPNLVWAGIADLKGKIERTYRDFITNRDKQIVLNWGPWGGGKTFSAYYFQHQNFSDNTLHVHQLYLRSPKNPAKATDEFFNGIIDSLEYDKIKSHIASLIASVGEDVLLDFLTRKIKSQEFAKAILMIGTADEDKQDLIQRYVYSGVTKTELKKLGLPREIVTDTDSIKFLSGILFCFIGDGTFYNGRVVIWLDEMEDLLYYPQKNYTAFSQVLRDLFDTVNEGLLTFMNFTFAESEEKTIQTLLGAALWSRISKRIRYKELDITLASEYILDLLRSAAINIQQPFAISQPSIQEFLSLIPATLLTPREINKRMNSLINYSLEKEQSPITVALINDWSQVYNEENE